MNNKVKKVISVLSAVIVINISSFAHAVFSDVDKNSSYSDEVNHLASLGIINGNENGEFKPDDPITREQFARLVIAAADEDYKAEIYKNLTLFPDVGSSRWSSGFVNAAVKLGYMKGMLDGKFHPTEGVTYAQACTVLIKMLGYTDSELLGTWPQSYLVKAKELGLCDGVNFTSNDQLPRWAVAVMLDNLLKAPLKANPSKTFIETIDTYLQYIVLATSKTSDKLAEGEVLTDKGTFILGDSKLKLEIGNKYRLNIDNNTINGTYSNMSDTLNISIENVNGNTITYSYGNGTSSMILPSTPVYYYNGVEQKYDSVPVLLEKCSSVVFNKNSSGKGYEYAVIADPIYSKPQVVRSSNLTNEGVGDIKFKAGLEITKSGSIISSTQIEQDDVVYEVSDIWGKNKYILVVEDTVSGEITDILPNKVSPKAVHINKVAYELGKYMDLTKINSQGVMKVKDSVTVILGYDGKVVDIYSSDFEDNSEYAFVLNNYKEKSTSVEDYGTEVTYVKLLHTDNTTKTYKLAEDGDDNNDLTYTAKLVKYKEVSEETDDESAIVELQKMDYLNSREYVIDTIKKTIDSHYFADNIKIFNVVNEIRGADCNVYLMDPSDLPDGVVFPGKIKYLNMVGAFKDVNVMVVDNILDEDKYLGIVTSKKSSYSPLKEVVYTNTVLIGDNEYITNYNSDDIYEGCVVEVEMRNGKIMDINRTMQPLLTATAFEAVDSSRVKVGGKIYDLKSNASIYFSDYDDEYERKGTDEIDITHKYDKISIYVDKSLKYGGEVELIIIED